ncbi:MAG TPA: prenyltransferase/squalene oxidase repeat-containing protein [Polyangia bacterium]
MNRPRFTPLPPVSSPSRALSGWRARLASDPIPRLLREGSPSVLARIRRDLIDDSEAPGLEEVWGYPEVKALVKKMEKDGSFAPKAPEKALGSADFATALATLRGLDRLADLGVRASADAGTAAAKKASKTPKELLKSVDFLLSSQEADGGLAALAISDSPKTPGKMPALHFQGWAVSALCRIGFENDPRVEKGLQFLIERRQDDGGWAWRGVRTDSAARPSSHLITGMVLRAFAASAARRGSRAARRAAELLATRFLQPDRYPDRKAPAFWEVLTEPRFYTDVLDALDTVTAIGLGKENSGVRTAEAYLRSRQGADGLWYPGPPLNKAEALAAVGKTKSDKAAAKEAAGKDGSKETEAAISLTLRVLVVLRRIN